MTTSEMKARVCAAIDRRADDIIRFGESVFACGPGGKGFLAKIVQYIGRECHVLIPHCGINALDAAKIGLMACDTIRSTFKDEDGIRFHPIITKGGDLVNVVPAFVQIETFVRGKSIAAIQDASVKIDRALRAGAYAVGAECRIYNIPGYLFSVVSPELKELLDANIIELVGEERLGYSASGGTTDANDVSQILPTLQTYAGGSVGAVHSASFRIVDPDLAYVKAAKMLAMTVVDLLADGAAQAQRVKEAYHAPLTKEGYLRLLEDLAK